VSVCPSVVVRYQLNEDVPAETKKSWRPRFTYDPCIGGKQAIPSSQKFLIFILFFTNPDGGGGCTLCHNVQISLSPLQSSPLINEGDNVDV
jgi:hypothetical protein